MRFKNFEIRKPTYVGPPPDDFKYRWDVVKWKDQHNSFTIAHLLWVKKEAWFEFKSCGLRYLEYREAGLEDWILAWCKTQEIVYKYEEEE
jgi:hypothetical protein